MDVPKALLRRNILFNFSSKKLTFYANPALFSSANVDTGTQALLNSLRKNTSLDLSKVLDLGCGYGPIAIFLAAQDPSRIVHAADRDLLAVEFTKHNAALNEATVNTFGTIGYANVHDTYHTIISNIPAKIGSKGIKDLIHTASQKLESGGQFCFVIVKEHEALIKNILEEPSITTTYHEKKKGHLIWHVTYSKQLDHIEDPYHKGFLHLPIRQPNRIETAYSIPEFDTLSYSTIALTKLLKRNKLPAHIRFVEPNQGAGPIIASEIGGAKNIHVVSRDLLRLSVSEKAIKDCAISATITYTAQAYPTSQNQETTIINIHHKNDRNVNGFTINHCTGDLIIYGPRPACKDFIDRGKLIDAEEIRHHGAYLLRKD